MKTKKSNSQAMADIFQGQQVKPNSERLAKINGKNNSGTCQDRLNENTQTAGIIFQEKCLLCDGKGYYQLKKGGVVEVCKECLLAGRFDQ